MEASPLSLWFPARFGLFSAPGRQAMGFGRNFILILCLLGLAGAADAQSRRRATADEQDAAKREVARFTSPTLTRFNSEEEFRRYLGAVLAADRYGQVPKPIQFAQAQIDGDVQSDAVEPICPDEFPD